MRTDLQIIHSAISDYNLAEIHEEDNANCYHFKFYSVDLPEKFRGLPMKWYFGILPELGVVGEEKSVQNNIINEARKLIIKSIHEKFLPLVMICDDPNIHLGDEMRFNKDAVFFLDKKDLPGKDFAARDIRHTPILLAAKSKFNSSEAPIFLSPYSPDKPVNDWRFFGRKKEIKDLVESESNYFVTGARKIGKTSLLQEAKRQLKDKGYNVHWIQVQYSHSIQNVIEEIARNLSVKDSYQAHQLAKYIDVNYLITVIKKLKTDKRKLILILDEIGNVLTRDKRNDWNFMGILRELSHNNEVRIIASAFQEIFIKQYYEPEGPFVNFGTILKVNVFSKQEIEELLINPLSIWGEISDKRELNRIIRRNIGSHPLILQYLGKFLFHKIFRNRGKKIEELVMDLLAGEELITFETAIDEVFKYNNSILERYIFLKICLNATENRKDLITVDITHREIERLLSEINIKSSFDERGFLLSRLSMRGLLYQDNSNRSLYRIASPIIYHFINKYYSVNELCTDYLVEINNNELSLKAT